MARRKTPPAGPVEWEHYARLDSLSVRQALCVLAGVDPAGGSNGDPKLRELFFAAIEAEVVHLLGGSGLYEAKLLGDDTRIATAQLIEWSSNKGIPLPEAFLRARRPSIALQKAPKEPSGKGVKSLYKLALAMANRSYGYDPRKQRNAATGKIVKALQHVGLQLDYNTVVKHLRDAWDGLSQDEKDHFPPPER